MTAPFATDCRGRSLTLTRNIIDPGSGAHLPAGSVFVVEDYAARVFGDSAPAALLSYGARVATDALPHDFRILYGKVNGIGYCVHETEVQL